MLTAEMAAQIAAMKHGDVGRIIKEIERAAGKGDTMICSVKLDGETIAVLNGLGYEITGNKRGGFWTDEYDISWGR